jgi:dipeptidyl aminopeptidase/acylaminoacyl peptidase
VDLLVGILPGSDWLLFASNRRGSLDLWGVPFREGKTGGPAVLVKQGLGRFFPSGFTNDGRYYYSTLSVTDDVFFVDFDRKTGKVSGEPRKLAAQWEGTNMDPAFSPDGEKLAYVTKRGAWPIPTHAADTLVIQSLKDTNLDPVLVSFDEFRLARVGVPCWVDNGKAIVLGVERGPQGGLYRVDLPDLRKTRIISAPEGRRITYHDCHAGSSSVYFVLGPEVLRIGSDGANERTLYRAPNGQRIDTIALSPDGGTLSLVTRVDNYRRALLLMPVGGGTPRQIHQFMQATGGGVSHAWAPDGKSIFYVVKKPKGWAWLLQRVPVEGAEVSEQMLEWPNPFYSPTFHPKGHLLAFTGRSGSSGASEGWVIENLKQELDSLVSTRDVR